MRLFLFHNLGSKQNRFSRILRFVLLIKKKISKMKIFLYCTSGVTLPVPAVFPRSPSAAQAVCPTPENKHIILIIMRVKGVHPKIRSFTTYDFQER